jgi:hypothetical protein
MVNQPLPGGAGARRGRTASRAVSRQLGRQSAGMAPPMTEATAGAARPPMATSSMDRPRSARVRLERLQAVEELVDEDVLALNQTGVGGLRRSPLVLAGDQAAGEREVGQDADPVPRRLVAVDVSRHLPGLGRYPTGPVECWSSAHERLAYKPVPAILVQTIDRPSMSPHRVAELALQISQVAIAPREPLQLLPVQLSRTAGSTGSIRSFS